MSPPISSPPALKFLVIDFTITCGTMELVFWCKTDVACHLWLHLTDQDYIIRRIPYTKRGAAVELSSVTCFVETLLIEQDEAGDTYEHTFTVPLIAYGRVHSWYLSGTQGGVAMTSVSQIFSAQCPAPPVYMDLPATTARGHWIGPWSANYTTVHNAANGKWRSYSYYPEAHQVKSGTTYYIRRAITTYDCSSLPPGLNVVAMKLIGYGYLQANKRDIQCVAVDGSGVPFNNSGYGSMRLRMIDLGHVDIPRGTAGWMNYEIPLNASGISLVMANAGGSVILGRRIDKDIISSAPGSNESQKLTGYPTILRVWYYA
jgi:hypothetical protein